jgi:hypothetical protein
VCTSRTTANCSSAVPRSPCTSPAAARDAGIAVIYQEPTLFPDLTVAENIFMGRQPLRAGRRIDGKLMRGQAAALFERLGVPARPGPDLPRPVHRGPADRGDRQGAVRGCPGDRDGRADRAPVRGRGRPVVRGCARPARGRRGGQSFTAGKLGKYTVGAGHSILLGPPFVFTKANINQFNF